jgi:uncharacterized protein (DUF1778 family)
MEQLQLDLTEDQHEIIERASVRAGVSMETFVLEVVRNEMLSDSDET